MHEYSWCAWLFFVCEWTWCAGLCPPRRLDRRCVVSLHIFHSLFIFLSSSSFCFVCHFSFFNSLNFFILDCWSMIVYDDCINISWLLTRTKHWLTSCTNWRVELPCAEKSFCLFLLTSDFLSSSFCLQCSKEDSSLPCVPICCVQIPSAVNNSFGPSNNVFGGGRGQRKVIVVQSKVVLLKWFCRMEQGRTSFNDASVIGALLTSVTQVLDWPATMMLLFAFSYWIFLFADVVVGEAVRKALHSLLVCMKRWLCVMSIVSFSIGIGIKGCNQDRKSVV